MGVREFDFTHPDFKKHSPERQKFYQRYHGQPLTEAAFVRVVSQALPRKGRRPSKRYCPSAARRQYHRLVKKYGFFPGGQ